MRILLPDFAVGRAVDARAGARDAGCVTLRYFTDGKPPGHGEDYYHHWVRWVAHRIARDGKPYPLVIAEADVARRAIEEQIFALEPESGALVIGAVGPPAEALALDPYQVWVENVTRCLESSPAPYELAVEEREWAERAIAAGVFEWERAPSTLRLRGGRPEGGGGANGPYR